LHDLALVLLNVRLVLVSKHLELQTVTFFLYSLLVQKVELCVLPLFFLRLHISNKILLSKAVVNSFIHSLLVLL
jgi:hypothetical protein